MCRQELDYFSSYKETKSVYGIYYHKIQLTIISYLNNVTAKGKLLEIIQIYEPINMVNYRQIISLKHSWSHIGYLELEVLMHITRVRNRKGILINQRFNLIIQQIM